MRNQIQENMQMLAEIIQEKFLMSKIIIMLKNRFTGQVTEYTHQSKKEEEYKEMHVQRLTKVIQILPNTSQVTNRKAASCTVNSCTDNGLYVSLINFWNYVFGK